MENIKQHLEMALKIIASISVRGDDVERIVAAKQEIRHAFAAVKELNKVAEKSAAAVGEVTEDVG